MQLIAEAEKKGHARSMYFHFLSTPVEIKGDKRVEEVVFGINEVKDGKVVATGENFSIKCGLVISAIGYESEEISGLVYEKGRVANEDGRVKGRNIYVVGWAKRGPSGVIGTNKSDSSDVMKLLVEDLTTPKTGKSLSEMLASKGTVHISQSQWELINQAEVAAGEPLGKPRVKFTDRNKMLGFAG